VEIKMVTCSKCQEEVEIEPIDEVDDLGIIDEDEEVKIHNILVEYECLTCGEVFTSTVTRAVLKGEKEDEE